MNTPTIFETLADGLDASTDGRGWGAEHERAKNLANAAPKMQALLRSLVADIGAMDQGEQMFGPFSEFVDWPLGMGVNWPNLAILRDEAKKLLAEGGA